MNVPIWTMIKNGALHKFTVLELMLMENMDIVAMTANLVNLIKNASKKEF